MAGSVNKAIIIGHLGRDPETRRNQQGDPICSFSVATSESWRDKQSGERKEKTEWHNVVIFNERLCDVAEQYLRKGSKVYVEGQIQTRKWQDKDGNDRYSTEIVISRFKGELTILTPIDRDDRAPRSDDAPRQASGGGRPASRPDLDDEIPFAPEFR